MIVSHGALDSYCLMFVLFPSAQKRNVCDGIGTLLLLCFIIACIYIKGSEIKNT